MRYDPIPDLVRLGYTWREAAFLRLVGTTSGFFLYRQYCEFIDRKLGGLAQQLIEKGAAFDHIEVLSYRQRRHVYHLKSRAIYGILGNAEADYHRVRGDAEVKTRLMVLDYLLANREEPFLTLEDEKVRFFLDTLRVPKAILPSRFSVAFDRAVPVATHYFPERFPIRVDEASSGRSISVRFTYIDYGALSVKRFARFLESYKPLLQQIGRFGIVYVADSPRNVAAAQAAFERAFPKTSRLLPLGLDHITNFFAAQALWDKNDPRFSQQDLATLKEGERLYTLPEHIELRSAWLKGRKDFDVQLARMGEKQVVQGSFSVCLLQRAYPVFSRRYGGRAPKEPVSSSFGVNSNFDSVAS